MVERDLTRDAARPAEAPVLLDTFGSPAAVVSNGPDYYGFVIGAI